MGRKRTLGKTELFEADACRKVVEEAHASPEKIVRDMHEDLVDEPGSKRLLAWRRTAQLHVLVARGGGSISTSCASRFGGDGGVISGVTSSPPTSTSAAHHNPNATAVATAMRVFGSSSKAVLLRPTLLMVNGDQEVLYASFPGFEHRLDDHAVRRRVVGGNHQVAVRFQQRPQFAR